MTLLPPDLVYGIRAEFHPLRDPAPNLIEAEIFSRRRSSLAEALRFYSRARSIRDTSNSFNRKKFAEIAELLNPGGVFLVSYVNLDRRRKILAVQQCAALQ